MGFFLDNSKILIIAAHPDDEVLGCGGLIAKFAKKFPIKIIVIGEGSTCRYEDENSPEAKNAMNIRETYLRESCDILGVSDVRIYNYRCGCLSTIPIIELNKVIEKNIKEFDPTHIFTHYRYDNNNDHRVISRATSMATRPNNISNLKYLFSYEIQSSTDWNFTDPKFDPNFYLELSEELLQKKINAMQAYQSEWSHLKVSRSPEGLKILAMYRGIETGVKYAEAFKLIRSIDKIS